MKSQTPISLLILGVLLFTDCIPNPTQNSTEDTALPEISNTPTLDWSQVPSHRAQLSLTTSSTWHNWAETTTVEPTIDQGPKYPAGNYGFDMLEVVKDVFGSETFYNAPAH